MRGAGTGRVAGERRSFNPFGAVHDGSGEGGGERVARVKCGVEHLVVLSLFLELLLQGLGVWFESCDYHAE